MADNILPPSIVGSVLTTQDELRLCSSPPNVSQAVTSTGGKERRQPSITPRKFRRFFTPRVSAKPTAARRALGDMTARALNRTPVSSPFQLNSSPLAGHNDADLDELPLTRSAKRRRTGQQTPETSPIRPSATTAFLNAVTPEPVSKIATASMLLTPLASSPLPAIVSEPTSDVDDCNMSDDIELQMLFRDPSLKSVVHLASRGLAGQLLQRELGTMPAAGHRQLQRPASDSRIETVDFYSSPDDIHPCFSSEDANTRCIPFCAAACNTNGLVAIGDEEGRVRLLDSSLGCSDGFNNICVSFPAHGNAVIDLVFSEDDRLLATASGDQTGKVFDMMTQTPISILDHHTASLKQVRFQPGRGEGSVLATSGRDGSIKIWDLRCKGGPAVDVMVQPAPQGLQYSLPRRVSQGCVVNSFYGAHARHTRPTRQMRKMMQAAAAADITTRWEEPGRVGEVSVTAIQFLPTGKEHLLLSACEADASIKLWDIRSIHTSRQKASTPISCTAPPESHSRWRPFGISSMNLSTDGSRLYSLCKDNTVYAYSTSHLILGNAPELSSKVSDHPRRRNGIIQEGLGPLYGFRHENFHASSFYVKAAVRPARNGYPELLAVGSSDGCAVLFPTDEQYFIESGNTRADAYRGPDHGLGLTPIFSVSSPTSAQTPVQSFDDSQGTIQRAPVRRCSGLFSTSNIASTQGRRTDTVPIVRNGTALIRGHERREVGSVCWTNEGSLVTVCDDQYIRCWREDRDRAADIRTGGERDGRRWLTGWADAGNDWDDDVDEWMVD